jgi:predicted DsbA family dithiol-disulfide isomerase
LNPEIPEQGMTLTELFRQKGQDVDIYQVMTRLKKTAADLGLPMGDRYHIYNTRLAQEVGLWAQSLGKGHAFHNAAFQAGFVDDQNLSQKTVLMDLAETAGLDSAAAETIIDDRLFSDAVDADWQLAKHQEIAVVPTLVMGTEKLVGARPYGAMVQLVARHME